MNSSIQAAFNSAHTYAAHATVQQQSARDLLAFASQHLEYLSQTTLLEVGCGDGALTTLLHNFCPHATITALDIAPNLLAIAKQKYPQHARVHWHCGDIATYNYPEHPYDCIYANFSLQWLVHPEVVYKHMLAHSKALCFAVPLASSCSALRTICAEYGVSLPLRDLPTIDALHSYTAGCTLHTYFRPYWMMFDTPLTALKYFKQIGAHASDRPATSLAKLRPITQPISLHFDVAHCVLTGR